MTKRLTNKARLNVIKAYAQISHTGHTTVLSLIGIPIGNCASDGTFAAFNSDHYRNLFGKYMSVRHRLTREIRRTYLLINKENRQSR